MNSTIKASAKAQLIHNDKIINQTNINANYNGADLNITGSNNDNLVYVSLNNDEIMKLLAIPANPISLEERLREDFNIGKKKYSTRKGKKKKRKKSHKLSKKHV